MKCRMLHCSSAASSTTQNEPARQDIDTAMAARAARHNKRHSGSRSHARRNFSLMVHAPEFGSGEELVINPECFPDVKVNDLVEISQPDREHPRLVLQVLSLNPVRGKLQISILKDLATQFKLDTFHNVVVQKVEPSEITVDYMELSFKDQFVSRADIWRVKVAMYGKCVYVGKHVETLGVRSQVDALLSNNQNVLCGVIGVDTKMIVRSRSSRLIWLVQMSTEMWEFAPDGELYYEKLMTRLLSILIAKWSEFSVSHSVTIIAFSRSYYDKSQFPDNYDPSVRPFCDPERQGYGPGCNFVNFANGYGPSIQVDPVSGRYYEDFYKVIVMNYTGPDWSYLINLLKTEFVNYHESHRWRTSEENIPAAYELCRAKPSDVEVVSHDGPDIVSAGTGAYYVKWHQLPYGVPSRALEGNLLEAINVTLNILDKHFMDRDLNRTGQSIVMFTAGSGVFKVDERMVEITKQRMMDNGVGMDMISLATPPLHVVPLFICHNASDRVTTADLIARSSVRSPISGFLLQSPPLPRSPTRDRLYIVPHWVNITFLEFDCKCALAWRNNGVNASSSAQFSSNKLISHRMYTCECQRKLNRQFTPLPPYRMFDTTAPTEKLAFPVALANLMAQKPRPRPVTAGEDTLPLPLSRRRESPRERKLSLLSDASPVVPAEQWQLCKSPDFVAAQSPRSSEVFAQAGLSVSLIARQVLEEYDDDVFTPAAWSNRRGGEDDDWDSEQGGRETSASLTSDMLSLLADKATGRWKSMSANTGLGGPSGGSSLMQSLLSPRSLVPHSRSTSSVNRLPSTSSPNFQPSPAPKALRQTSESIEKSPALSSAASGTSPLLEAAPRAIPHERRLRSNSSREDQGRIEDLPSIESKSPPLSCSLKSSDRLFRSPPIPRSTTMMLFPPPLELSGSYQKPSVLTGNGMFPGMRRESDQTSITPLVGSYAPSTAGVSQDHVTITSHVNPFKYSSETLESTTARLTSDRRRWSHLFPVLGSTANDPEQTHLGPNWKSLTNPAILPLTTDYYPTPKELFMNYTESFYSLTLPSTDGDVFPKYKNHDELLIEMICQRLASDFQLVTKEAADTEADQPIRYLNATRDADAGDRSAHTSSKTYHLSMGHRIHQIIFDAELQAIEVKRYVERGSYGELNEPVLYKYSLWVDRTQSFHPLQQDFFQFPKPETNWNSLDHLLCGSHDDMSEMIKYRRIRFAVLPPLGQALDEKQAYATKFTRFVDYLQTRVASQHGAQEKITINVSLEPMESPNLKQQIGSLSYKMSCDSMASYVRLKSEDPRNEWLTMHVEDTMYVDKCYHFDVRWLACSGIIVDDFISTIRRKAKQAGLELRRIPEYTSVSFLQIHPLIAPTFLPMPLEIMQSDSDQEKSLVAELVNRLDFVLDEERLADKRGIGYGLGLGRDDEQVTGGVYTGARSAKLSRRFLSPEEARAAKLETWRRRGYKQYMHRQAPVFLRLIRNGIVWIPSYDYEQLSTPQQVDQLFTEICHLVQASSTLTNLVAECCATEAA